MLAKAAAFGTAWLFLPEGLFLLSAFGLYLVPFFRPHSLAIPFLGLIVLTQTFPPQGALAVLFAVIFFLVCGIKDLVLIERSAAYQTLVYLLLFATYLDFFGKVPSLEAAGLLPRSLAAALFLFLLTRPVLEKGVRGSLFAAAGALVLWQWSWALVFLPLNHFTQAALQFLAALTFLELAAEYGRGTLGRRKILAQFTVFFVGFAIVLAANSWRV